MTSTINNNNKAKTETLETLSSYQTNNIRIKRCWICGDIAIGMFFKFNHI